MRMSRQGPSLLVQTPAKVNLSLKILGRRQDGFHELETVMVSVRLFDSLRIQPAAKNSLELECRSLSRWITPPPADEHNLVLRAARLLADHCGINSGARLTLEKRIPSEAGLGGGSSDAAATLAGLNRFWRFGLSLTDLHALAAQLGSDVNFFLENTPAAVCTGRGERISPLKMPHPLAVVIVKPASGLSTRAVFAEWSRVSRNSEFGTGGVAVANDLEPAARRLNPDIDRVLSALLREEPHPPAACGMSGSGSACFAVCRSYRHAQQRAARARAQGLGEAFAVMTGC